VKVLIAYRDLPEDRLARLRALSPDLEVTAVPFSPTVADRTPSPQLLAELGDAEVLLGYFLPPHLPALAPCLRWVEGPADGLDYAEGAAGGLTGITVTNAGGATAVPVAEFAMAGILWFAKRLADFAPHRRAHRYERLATSALAGRTVGIVGYGAIGRAVARFARALGMRVLATRRTPGLEPPDGVDAIFPLERLHDLLAASDYVVLCLPLTPASRHLIDAGALAALRPETVFVNVARGPIVDEPALIAALRTGRLRGAVLDVFWEEPLPPDSPLWDMDNVLLTPHNAGNLDDRSRRVFDHFEDNLRRHLAGQPLRDVFDPARGY
jgi:phosphoglycerate dehydrogenase-like enzyme